MLFLRLLQPQNIVLMGDFPNCEIKLCDLECARIIQEGNPIREMLGTTDFVGESSVGHQEGSREITNVYVGFQPPRC